MNKSKKYIFKNFSWIDLLVCVIYLAVSIAIPIGIISLHIGFRFLIALGIFVILLITMIFLKNQNCRIYRYIFNVFKFRSQLKSFEKDKHIKSSDKLLPFSAIEDNEFVKIEDDKINNFKVNDQYLAIFKIKGLDVTILNQKELEIKFSALHTLIKNIKTNFSIAKINQQVFYQTQNKYIDDLVLQNYDQYINLEISEQLYKQRLKQLSDFKTTFEKDDLNHHLNKNMFIILYAPNKENLKEVIAQMQNDIISTGLVAQQLDKVGVINFVKNIFNPFSKNVDSKIANEFDNDLKRLFSFSSIQFKKNHVNINDELYLSFNSIQDYPLEINDFWLADIFLNTDANIMLNISDMSFEETKEIIDNSIANSISDVKKSKKVDSSFLTADFKDLSNRVMSDTEVIKKVSTVFLNYATDYDTLMKCDEQLSLKLKNKNIVLNKLHFKQFEGYLSFVLGNNDKLVNLLSKPIPSRTLAHGFPFLLNPINDKHGFILGYDYFKQNVCFDLFTLDKTRKNHNAIIIGNSGAGKSFLIKKMLNWNIANGNNVYVLDPEREYKNLCHYYNGEWINVAESTNCCINPLQIFSFTDDLDSFTLISNHLIYLEAFFKILFPDLNTFELGILMKCLADVYNEFGLYQKNIKDLSPKEFPIIQDLFEYIKNNQKKLFSKYEPNFLKNIINVLESNFIGNGKYNNLYNKHSVFNVDNKFKVFDLNTLFEKNNKQMIQAQMYLILNLVQNLINKNSNDKKSLVVIDEGHLLIDENNPIALDFVFQLAKRIRKRNGSIMLATQNLEDFNATKEIAKKTMAIFNNSQYSFFLNLSLTNLKTLIDLYKSSGNSLSEQEQEFLSKASVGECLLIMSTMDRYQVKINVDQFEIDAFNNQVEDIANE